MRTYKLFDNSEEEFNIVSRSFYNIQEVCKLMCECTFLSDQDVYHYVQIGGLPHEIIKDQAVLFFEKKWDKHNYLMGLAPVLFKDAPSIYEVSSDGEPKLKSKVTIGDKDYTGKEARGMFNAEECYSAFGFFLSCIGETLHDHRLFLNSLTAIQQMGINLEEITEDGGA